MKKNKKLKEYLIVFHFTDFEGSFGFGNYAITFDKKVKITKNIIRDIETKIKGENKYVKNVVIINIIELGIEK